jgi:hypothetical protein
MINFWRGFFYVVGIAIYCIFIYGVFLLTTYILKTGLGIYDIERDIKEIREKLE